MNLIDRRAARYSRWMAAGALCAMLTGCGGPDSSDHLARGAKFEAQNDLNSALIEYRSAAAASPDAADVRWALGKLLLKLGDGRTAEKEINAALHAGLKDPEAVYAKARAMLIVQDAQAAETYLSQHIPKPPTTRYLITLGDTNAALNKLADATANYTAALELNPKASDALLGLARINLSQGKAQEAAKLAAQAAALNDGNFETPVVQGNIAFNQGRYAQSTEYFKAGVKAAPFLLVAKLGVVQSLLASGHTADAAPYVELAVQQAPKSPVVATFQANLLAAQNKTEEAIDLCRKILSNYPNQAQAQLLLGGLLFKSGKYESAEEYLSAFSNSNPASALGRRLLVMTRVALHEPDKAIAMASEGIDLKTVDDAYLLAVVATAYMQAGKPKEALALLERATLLAPKDQVMEYRTLSLQLASGDVDKALEKLKAMPGATATFAPSQRLLISYQLSRQNFDEALAIAQDALKISPNDPVVRHLLATTLLAKDDKHGARIALDELLKLNADYTPAILDMASLDMDEGKLDAARTGLQNLVKREPKNPSAKALLAMVLTGDGHPEGATAILEDCQTAAPEDVGCAVALATNYFALGRFRDANTAVDQALKLSPSNPRMNLLAGDLAILRRAPEDALKKYQALAAVNPESPDILLRLAKTEFALRDTTASEKHLQQVLLKEPESVEALQFSAVMDLSRRNIDAARATLNKCMQLEKKAGGCHELAGDVAASQKDFETALKRYETVDPQSKELRVLVKRARVLRASHRADGAVQLLDRWLAEHPKDTQALFVKAEMAKEDGKNDEAGALYEKILAINATEPAALNNLALIYLAARDKRAPDVAKKVFDMAPDNDNIADTYGWVLINTGKAEQGVPLVARASKNAPRNPSFRYHHAVGQLMLGDASSARTNLKLALQTTNFPERIAAEKLEAELK